MTKSKRGLCCPCRVGAKKKACGLKGLAGTQAEHRKAATGMIRRAQGILRSYDWKTENCAERVTAALVVLDLASRAEAEAAWLGTEGRKLDATAGRLQAIARSAIRLRSKCK